MTMFKTFMTIKKRVLDGLVNVGVMLVRFKLKKLAGVYFRIISPAIIILNKQYKPFTPL